MTAKEISDFDAAASLDGTEILVGDVAGVTKNFTTQQVANLAPGGSGAVASVDGQTGVVVLSAVYQPLDGDTTAIAALDSSTSGAIASDGAGWIKKTYAQLKTALGLVKADVGLGNVDNTSDATKNAAAVTLTNKTLTSPVITTPTGIVKGDVGLGSVDNTADTAKPVSTAQQTALNLKANLASPTFTGTVTIPTGGSITAPTGLVKGDVGLGNVDNTADASKAFAGTQITSGTVPIARIPTGTTSATVPLGGVITGAGPTGDASHTLTLTYNAAGQLTAVANNAIAIAESQVTNLTTDLAARMNALAPTAVKTTTYSAAANDFVPCDTASGGFTVTLPNAPADKTIVAIKHVIQGSTNVVTYACAGSDVINKTAGATSGTLTLLAQAVLLQYKASGAIWYIVADDLALAQLDLRFMAAPSGFTTHGVAVAASSTSLASTSAGTSGQVLTSTGASSDPTFQNLDVSQLANGSIVTIQARSFLK